MAHSESHEAHEAHDDHQAHGSVQEYVRGLILSFILTAIPFGVAASGLLSPSLAIGVILLCAFAQVMVQLVFFLHMSLTPSQHWNIMSAVLTVILVAILVIGSVWVMQHMNHNMLMGH